MARPKLDIKNELWRRRCSQWRKENTLFPAPIVSAEELEGFKQLKVDPIIVDCDTYEWVLKESTP